MGTQDDFVDRAFSIILADGRRKLEEADRAAAAALWRKVFRRTPEKLILDAVEVWLQENRKGRPNIGEIEEVLRRGTPTASKEEAAAAATDRAALRWAVAVLEGIARGGEWAQRMSHPNYLHTVQYAEKELRHHGFQHWHDAKAYLEPGWAPVTITEVYL